uniref:Lipoprotein n=1 Tax=Steinernema glaseri TaxID=37863 RepID=A0A1I8A301_9BILA
MSLLSIALCAASVGSIAVLVVGCSSLAKNKSKPAKTTTSGATPVSAAQLDQALQKTQSVSDGSTNVPKKAAVPRNEPTMVLTLRAPDVGNGDEAL